ncbi:hypothetical protein VCRA2119O147_400031 [Vibrio crassostreae]|nr:hypothetical protein VCRA2118O144_110147 [Vibrio crassostreae]CAK1737546.1 hypothetical protein VCRA2110O173_130004 [Vibrio crassostreae]CAK1945455.1 hypothetical protein VCRA2113O351_260022 [Vibrio crassostreae]CAK2002059.1 hypothetical protein VCRA2113O207_320018 [Vibrio crassostreae]CAK2013308.1 hypothetical protein VCRA2113O356_300003 [Vibrio crassostreae]
MLAYPNSKNDGDPMLISFASFSADDTVMERIRRRMDCAVSCGLTVAINSDILVSVCFVDPCT